MSLGVAQADNGQVFRFDGFTLDLQRGRLSGPAGDVTLRPKVFALLAYLAQHAGRVVPKAELLDAVWPDVTVTEESLSQCVHALRGALGASGPALIRTMSRRGYLLDLAATMKPVAVAAVPTTVVDAMIPAMRQGSIAVMPFEMSLQIPVHDQLWFDGVVNDVISQLARLRGFDVIARGSTFALRHIASDPVRAGQRLGVAYVLAGAVTPRGTSFALQVDLVRVETGAIVWTDEIGVDQAKLLGLVGDLTDRIIGAVLSGITTSERNRARLVPDQSLTAWQAYHRGLEAFATYTDVTLLQACAYFEHATKLDPGFVRAYAGLSECHATLARAPFCMDKKSRADAALRVAERAILRDESAPSAQFAYAHARWLHGDPDVGRVHAQQSVALSPSFADGYAEIGFYEALYGDPDKALASLARTEVLNPFSPFNDSVNIDRALAHLQKNNLEQAAICALAAINRRESYPQMQLTGAVMLAAAGRLHEACRIVETFRHRKEDYDAMKIFKPPFSLRGPAKDRLQRALAEIGL
jgi:DNA-binding winged helix-turn-helix (wHTH) protein/TolB-like protein/tetratricopeptide (TPR) repeat protein